MHSVVSATVTSRRTAPAPSTDVTAALGLATAAAPLSKRHDTLAFAGAVARTTAVRVPASSETTLAATRVESDARCCTAKLALAVTFSTAAVAVSATSTVLAPPAPALMDSTAVLPDACVKLTAAPAAPPPRNAAVHCVYTGSDVPVVTGDTVKRAAPDPHTMPGPVTPPASCRVGSGAESLATDPSAKGVPAMAAEPEAACVASRVVPCASVAASLATSTTRAKAALGVGSVSVRTATDTRDDDEDVWRRVAAAAGDGGFSTASRPSASAVALSALAVTVPDATGSTSRRSACTDRPVGSSVTTGASTSGVAVVEAAKALRLEVAEALSL
jgi:hypothetical protein